MIKQPLTPNELYEKFEEYLKTAVVLGGINFSSCKMSLPSVFFDPIERHLKSEARTAEDRINEGYILAYGDNHFILVKTKVNTTKGLEDMLVMVPTEQKYVTNTGQNLEIMPNEFGEQTFVAYLPKQGAIAVMAIKASSPNVATSFFYPNNIETLSFHAYSDLKDITLYLEKQLGQGLYKPASLKAGISLLREIMDK